MSMETDVKIRNKGTDREELRITSNRISVSCLNGYDIFEITMETWDDEVTFTTDSPSDIYEILDCLNIAMSQYQRKLSDDEKVKRLRAQIKDIEAEIEKIGNWDDTWSNL